MCDFIFLPTRLTKRVESSNQAVFSDLLQLDLG